MLRFLISIRNQMLNLLLIGDRDDSILAHQMIPRAVALAAEQLEIEVDLEWIPTISIHNADRIASQLPHAIWCVPGSPYANMDGALTAIQFARTRNIPFLGTCGGFQHALIEYARNVLGIDEADHAESNPNTSMPVIHKLQCSLVERSETVTFAEGSKLQTIYDSPHSTEGYHCSYGVNPDLISAFEGSDLRFTAHSPDKGVRAFELENHPFFIGTLFQPERSAAISLANPLISAFLKSSKLQ